MCSEISQAFAHPIERAIATAATSADRISVRGHIVDVEIGAFQQERGTTQRVRFDIVVEVVSEQAPVEDDVDRILSYDKVTEAIYHELAAERLNLLETLADRIALRILLEPMAQRTFVRIEKLDRGPGALGVEIVRSRRQMRDRLDAEQDDTPCPRVLFVENSVLMSDELSCRIDDCLNQSPAPIVICVGLPNAPCAKAAHPLSQRRIDLLAIEQNAWVLAARDPRLLVVSTRTELDWSMRNGRISVWAPSKIVLDSGETLGAIPEDAFGLAHWFAKEISALSAVEKLV